MVDPHRLISRFGVDPLRFFLLKDGSLHHDGGEVTTLFPPPSPSLSFASLLSLFPSGSPSLPPSSLFCPPFLPADYSEECLVSMTNADLPNTLGNLLQRVTTPRLNPGGPKLEFSPTLFPTGGQSQSSLEFRATEDDHRLINNLQSLPGKQIFLVYSNIVIIIIYLAVIVIETVAIHYDGFEFNKGIAAIMKCLYRVS